jgi:hypothetical protein
MRGAVRRRRGDARSRKNRRDVRRGLAGGRSLLIGIMGSQLVNWASQLMIFWAKLRRVLENLMAH